jgi:hypothetical protein
MATSWSTVRRHDHERSASPTVSRLIVLVFMTAAALGLLSGAGWMAWTFVRRTAGG